MKTREEVLSEFLQKMSPELRQLVEFFFVAVHEENWKSASQFAREMVKYCLKAFHNQQ